MRLAVYPDGAVVVTAPRVFDLSTIEHFVARHSEWILRKTSLVVGSEVLRIKRTDIPRLKKQALQFLKERVAHFAARYGLAYAKITVRAQNTRWGSCSRKGNLSFNYKIAVLPPELADYIIVHEVCHLAEFNHSKDFWALVAREVPQHKMLRARLKRVRTMYS